MNNSSDIRNLITVHDINKIRSISQNIDDVNKIDPYIKEAQVFDVQPILDCDNVEFLSEIVTNKNQQGYAELISYISPVLAYYSYARFLSNAGVHITNAGVVSKVTEYSEPVNERTLARVIMQAQSSALEYQKKLTDYLEANKTDWPEWKCSTVQGRKKSGARISAVGGNSNNESSGCYEDYLNQ